MRPRRRISTSIVIAAVALGLVAGPALGDGKPDTPAKLGDQRPVAADLAAGKAALTVSAEATQASAAIQSRILQHVRAKGTKYTFGAYADALTGKVVVETDAPSDVVDSLVGDNSKGLVEVRKQTATDDFTRRDDVPAFWGGSGITFAAPNGHCSAGYTVQNSAGTRFMVTAGHCFANGATAVTELGGRVVGVASGNGLPGEDMVLLGGQSYAPFVYVGGVDSSTGHHVASAANPIVGFNNYCHSGRTTGEHCGHTVSSITGTVCTSSGCKSPVIVYSGGTLPQGGDSGAPFYALSVSADDKHIRGHHIASSGTTRYAEMWSRVQARFGVSIVT
ncbi:S1 family peptidase [Lentzea sp. HUAS12]|uniref:S1 family peptidase n=1 Tax=Lentzea sp. HUAS12 TaxID=2951806 RepID=UPI0020A017BF|nr:S1 family peptidase [Lentzea sp. HUAS12]USX53592.1 S1 family peptidase [Lentzea sp. HUAS12]